MTDTRLPFTKGNKYKVLEKLEQKLLENSQGY